MFFRIAVFLFAVVCPISAYAQANGKLQIHYMDVGQGDGAVLISPFGEVVLFDSGVLNQCSKPIAYLQSIGVTKIDYHIASHYHSDHIGCAPQVLQQFPLQKAAYDRGGSYSTATFTSYVNAVGAKRVTAQKGQTITLDQGSLTPVRITFVALNGNGVTMSDENDLSLVAVVRFGDFDAEFGGDLSGSGTGSVDPDPADAPPAASCTYAIAPTSHSASASGGSVSIAVTTTSGCVWTASSGVSWVTVASGTTGSGSGTATFSVAANTGASRSGSLTVAGHTVSVTQSAAAAGCSFTVSPTSTSVGSSGGSFSVSVATSTGCAWTASSQASWMTVSSGSTGSGNGSATFNVSSNGSTSRSGSVTVAGRSVSVSQAATVSAPTCCAVCTTGKACGDSCISRSFTCSKPPGCACNGLVSEESLEAFPWLNSAPFSTKGTTPATPQFLTYTPVEGPPVAYSYADIESGVATAVGQIEVYKVHHHGSSSSSNTAWLAATTPKVGIVSVSATNSYGHPTATAMTRLHNSNVKTYWTSAGKGAAPVSGQDFVSTGTAIVIEAAPVATTFTVRYNSTTETYANWGAVANPVAAPFGGFDTPSEGSVVNGSIAVTGWALDDTAVTKVDIQRDAHPNDPPGAAVNGRVFVGTASFVAGARTDIATSYATYPNADRAGWGYLMLTRGLIWDGQGSFNLYAVATDSQGNTTTLGSKRITINNAIATKPFGNIDSPGQGAAISGLYPVTGWVLTPNAGATIPAGNVRVAIDGVFLPDVPSVSDRADITAGFSTMNTTGAGRGLFIDTTKYTNGVHTIGWLVTDSTGQADGIGSRFFTIANPAILTTTAEMGTKR